MSVSSILRVTLRVTMLTGALACGDLSKLAGKQSLPAGTLDPKSLHTAAGAMALYQAELAAFQGANAGAVVEIGSDTAKPAVGAFVSYAINSGMLTDELRSVGDRGVFTDARQLPEANGTPDLGSYVGLQGIRGGATTAIGALTAYAQDASPALVGHMYALQGYAEIMLADLYCSGVPLSTLDFNGDFTYHAGSTTVQVYQDAIAQFDQALAHSADSTRILNLARVGKARALLALGNLDSAALVVAEVPDGFSYQFLVDWTNHADNRMAIANAEGGNGLPYIVDGANDPRVTSSVYGTSPTNGLTLYTPVKYNTGIAPMVVADWIEARLIRAEAALASAPNDSSGWLGQLNYLRAHAITPALPGLSDPVDSAARLALLFKERAYWLFVSGHRQGDMRRLVRNYHLSAEQVYPTGPYPNGQFLHYGSDVNAPVPAAEQSNPLFTGCLSRGA